jgi:hypothetical protein
MRCPADGGTCSRFLFITIFGGGRCIWWLQQALFSGAHQPNLIIANNYELLNYDKDCGALWHEF